MPLDVIQSSPVPIASLSVVTKKQIRQRFVATSFVYCPQAGEDFRLLAYPVRLVDFIPNPAVGCSGVSHRRTHSPLVSRTRNWPSCAGGPRCVQPQEDWTAAPLW